MEEGGEGGLVGGVFGVGGLGAQEVVVAQGAVEFSGEGGFVAVEGAQGIEVGAKAVGQAAIDDLGGGWGWEFGEVLLFGGEVALVDFAFGEGEEVLFGELGALEEFVVGEEGDVFAGVVAVAFEDFGFDAVEALEAAVGGGDAFDEEEFLGAAGGHIQEHGVFEGGVGGGVFVGEAGSFGLSGQAVFKGIHGNFGFTGGGGGAGGFLGIAAVGVDATLGGGGLGHGWWVLWFGGRYFEYDAC